MTQKGCAGSVEEALICIALIVNGRIKAVNALQARRASTPFAALRPPSGRSSPVSAYRPLFASLSRYAEARGQARACLSQALVFPYTNSTGLCPLYDSIGALKARQKAVCGGY